MKKEFFGFFTYIILALLCMLCIPLLVHEFGMDLSFKDGISVGLLILAQILYVPSIFVNNREIKKRIFIADGILAVFTLIWTISCLNGHFIVPLIATAVFAGNILYGNMLHTKDNKEKLLAQESRQLEKDIKINNEDGAGKTPLIIAACNNYENIIGVLLNDGAEINAKDKDGKTALIWAAYYGYDNIVKTLLSKGADKSIKDNNGNTALDYAEKRVHPEAAQLLKSDIAK